MKTSVDPRDSLADVGWRWRPRLLFATLVSVTALLGMTAATAMSAQEAEAQPTVQDILRSHYEARGGLDQIKALVGLEIEGTLDAGGMALPFVVRQTRPNLYRMDVDFQGTAITQSYDGEMAWGVNPPSGMAEAGELGAAEARALARDANFDSVLIGFGRLGAKLDYRGVVEVDGERLHEIHIVRQDGSEETVWLGEDFLERRWRRTAFVEGVGETTVDTLILGHKEVAGVKVVSSQQVTTPAGVLKFNYDRIRSVEAIPLADFQMPGQQADAALTLAQILSRHAEARLPAGSESVMSVKATGTVVFQGFELPMTMVFQRPKKARVTIDLSGMQMVLASDGETAWTVSPMQGITEPEEFGPEAADAVQLFSDFLWGLLNDHEARGLELALQGIEKAGRHEAYYLEATTSAGARRELWLGGEDFLEHQIRLEAEFLGAAQTLTAELADYRQTGPILMPHSIAINGSTMQIALTVVEVEVDPEIDESVFTMPPKTSENP